MVASARFDPGPTYASGERSARSSSSIRASRWSVSGWASSRAIRRLWMLYRRGRRSRPRGGPLKSFAIASRKPGAFKCSFAALGSPALLRSAGFNTSNATSSAASRAELSANDSCSHQSPGARLPRECNITLCDIASSVFARKSLQIGGSVSRQRAFTRQSADRRRRGRPPGIRGFNQRAARLSSFGGIATFPTTRARCSGGSGPFTQEWTSGMSYPRSARIRTATGIQMPRMANGPFSRGCRWGRSCLSKRRGDAEICGSGCLSSSAAKTFASPSSARPSPSPNSSARQ